MIDCVLKFTSEAAAIAALPDDAPRGWLLDHCIAGITVWRKSQEVVGQITDPILGLRSTTTITPLAGFFVLVAMNSLRPAVINLAQVQFAADRDMAAARIPGMVVKSNLTNTVLQDIRVAPLFAGMDWPFGAWA